MNTQVIHDTLASWLDERKSFPDVVGTLSAEGVESYRADLVRMEETFYAPNGETHVEKMNYPAKSIGERFATAEVISAIRDSQAGKCKYPEFLNRVTSAGTTGYVAYLSGREVIYFGRKGEFHIEEFPRSDS